MTAYKGILVLIKVGDGAISESFTTIGGLRISIMELDNHLLDATNVESGAWRQLRSSVGIHYMRVSGGGLFTDSASEEQVREYAFSNSVNNYRFIFANGDYVQGAFTISSYERSGNHDGEELYSLTLESAGAISFNS